MGRFENVADLAAIAPDSVALDLACGQGRTTRALLAAGPRLVHAVDVGSTLDDDLLLDPRVRAHIAELDALPLEDDSVDAAVSLNAVEHLADVGAHLHEVHRVLRPGGTAVLAHSDWDTALFTSDDDDLTRELLDRFVAHVPAQGPAPTGSPAASCSGTPPPAPSPSSRCTPGPTRTAASTRGPWRGRWPPASSRPPATTPAWPPAPPAGSRGCDGPRAAGPSSSR